jgi:hypothetical protein
VLIYDEPDKTWRRINANPNNPAVTGRVDLGSGTTSFGIEPGLNKSDRWSRCTHPADTVLH